MPPSLLPRKRDLGILTQRIKDFPVTAILGPRQCGKSTIAKELSPSHRFDLESPRDLARLQSPMTALEPLEGLVMIDEIQRQPDLFPLLRHLCDEDPRRRFLILGSASRDLIRQSSESLAGRINYHALGGFRIQDIGNPTELWVRGGFPSSYLARSDEASDVWRQQYVTTFLERDVPQLGIRIPSATLRRFWTMLAHYHGQILNLSELGTNFGISDKTVRHYVEILVGTFMVRLLQPWLPNVGKRQVKTPKLYLRDSGIFHALMRMSGMDDILSHPKLGASWEGFALEQCIQVLELDDGEVFFWKPHDGTAELDLFFLRNGRPHGIEFKFADAPTVSRSMRNAIETLELSHLWVVYPGPTTYELADNITVLPLTEIARRLAPPG
jgi:hypothetical protein